MSNELEVLKNINAVEVFTCGGTDKILQAIREEVINDIPDTTTAKGRAEIASRAHKVAKSKVAIDKLGKELADKLNAQLKPINAVRIKSKDTLEALKDEVREPLTVWEDAEAQRVITLKERLTSFDFSLDRYLGWSIEQVAESLKISNAIELDESWEEFKTQAEDAKPIFIEKLTAYLAELVEKKKQADELIKLQKEKEERERLEREEAIRKEATAKAEQEAKQAAINAEVESKRLIAKAEQDKKDAETRAEGLKNAAEAQAKAAAEKAEADKKAAIEAERQRVQKLKEEVEKEAADREANTAHKKKVNNSILKALSSETGISEEVAKSIIKAIHLNKIPNTKINY